MVEQRGDRYNTYSFIYIILPPLRATLQTGSARAYATNLEDLGKLGFGHYGIGSNYAIGGNVAAPCHIDIIYSQASLEIDGKLLLDQGSLLI